MMVSQRFAEMSAVDGLRGYEKFPSPFRFEGSQISIINTINDIVSDM